MNSFGDTVRSLRTAQSLGLRETAMKIGISPAYLSRIERGKERPPRPDVIKKIAKELAADPDVLFRLSSSTDPEIISYIHDNPSVLVLLHQIIDSDFSEEDTNLLIQTAERIKAGAKTHSDS